MAVYKKITQILEKVFSTNKRAATPNLNIKHVAPQIIEHRERVAASAELIQRDKHNVSRKKISANALKVLYKLHNSGYQAFLVGGCVRDILLGQEPKDFDVATNAKPEQVRNLFRNCRLIGKRFVLAHIHFDKEIIEVATFRAAGNNEHTSHNGQIMRDNVYGSLDDDVWRRDFTANALYYDISNFSIVDYTNGMQDVHDKILRLIGEPIQRYHEDPVRMLRAVRFAAKLDFNLAASTEEPLYHLGHLLRNVPPARLHEEVLKLFLTGYGVKSFAKLQQFDLFKYLFPSKVLDLEQEFNYNLVQQLLINTDNRFQASQSIAPAFLFMGLLWPAINDKLLLNTDISLTEQDLIINTSNVILSWQNKHVLIPRRMLVNMQEIWLLQPRLTRRKDRRCFAVLAHPRFRAAYDFLVLRGLAGDDLAQESAIWWEKFQLAEQDQRQNLINNTNRKKRKKRKRQSNPPTGDVNGA
jgi:poly(A) polymerase